MLFVTFPGLGPMLGSPYDTAIAALQRHAVDEKQMIPGSRTWIRMSVSFEIDGVLPVPTMIGVWLLS